MSFYFENFPQITYKGQTAIDLSRRNRFLKTLSNNPMLFLPYTVKEGEKPEDVAYYYYGSNEYVWAVLLANNIIDIYNEWPLSEYDFHKYLINKYEKQSGKIGYEVVDWTKNQQTASNILYYYLYVNSKTDYVKLTPESFRTLYLRKENNIILLTEKGSRIIIRQIIIEDWIPYRIYDYEYTLNENKREIYLIDKRYIQQVNTELQNGLIDINA